MNSAHFHEAAEGCLQIFANELLTVFKEFAVAAREGRFRLINAAALNDAAERSLDVVDAFKVTCSISAEYAVGKNGSARILKTHNLCAEHIGLD